MPLQLAACQPGFVRPTDRCQAMDMLLRAGASPGERRGDAEANTPLHDACRRGDLSIVQLLLRHKADPNVANGFGETPLCLALRLAGGHLTPPATVRAIAEELFMAGGSPLAISFDDTYGPAPWEADGELQALLSRWTNWWRLRLLAWAHSRGRGHVICWLLPETLVQVGSFL